MVLSRISFACPILSAFLVAAELPAQSRESGIPTMAAARLDGAIQVDGRLDEHAWRLAAPATAFVQGEPIEGVPAEAETEVRVLYDDEALYIGARLHEADPATIARQLVRRDEWGPYDAFEVGLDPNSDRRTGYLFRVSAAGVQGDAYLFDDTEEDDSWNAVWESDVSIDAGGWNVEIRIPLSQIRYEPDDDPQSWGINFSRRRIASNERSYFALISRQRHGVVSAFGRLTGIEIREGTRRLEVRPYVLAGAERAPATPGDPFFDGSSFASNAGADVRYGLGTSFTLDLTVNPDFGQVEVDPAVINLTAFETFFPEQRPFFVEDGRVFDYSLSGGDNSLFYTRRIGRAPQGRTPDDADFAEVPDQTTIVGAAKLTGQTAGGLSVGAFAALTDRERGRAYFTDDDRFDGFDAEPRTGYGVLRVRQDLRDGASQIGAIVTALHRQLPGDGTFDFLSSEAFGAGIDFEHSWADRGWAVWGFLAGSLVRGSTEAITRLQRSSNHYFQRPDAAGLGVDSAATSMVGAEWRLQLERRSGRNWTGAIWLAERTPGFDPNDLGYMRGSERLDGGARLSYQEITPGRVLRNYRFSATTYHNWRHDALRDAFSWDSWGRAHKAGAVSLDANLTFLNYWELNIDTEYSPETVSDAATRGGPLMIEPAELQFGVRAETDSRSTVSVEPSIDLADTRHGGRSFSAGLEVNFRPSPRWELSLEPSYERERDTGQYVAAIDDPGFVPTFGRRYLFADLEQRAFSLETRLDVTFTPRLTLQLFVQPLLSAGEYVTYKQFARAGGYDFDILAEGTLAGTPEDGLACAGGRICADGDERHVDFDGDSSVDLTIDDQDFNVRSLRGNAVLRWEWRPGSTLFLVWQQRRELSDTDAAGFDVIRDTRSLFGAASENVFIIKANYWFGL